MTRVLIIDDHPLLAEALKTALESDTFEVTVVDPSVTDPLEALTADEVDFCLLDLDWGRGEYAGASFIPHVLDQGATCVILTGTDEPSLYGYCLELGAVGILRKQSSFADFGAAVRRVLDGESPNSDAEKYRWLLEANRAREEHRRRLAPFGDLTPAEARVLHDLANGRGATEIAELRVVAISTVRSHIRQILRKLGVGSQLAAVALARQSGWPPPPQVAEGIVGDRPVVRLPHAN